MSQIKQIIPENLHHSVLNQLDRVASSKRPSIEKAALLFPLSGAALITNIAAAASESLHLLGQLCLAGVKYGAIGTLRVLTRSNACESLYKKLPDGKCLTKTIIKICKLILGIFYSLLGLALPGFNLRRQEELGLFNRKKAAQPSPAEKPAVKELPELPKDISDRKIEPLILDNKKTAPKSRLKKPVAKQKVALKPTREELAKVRMAEFLRAFQIVEFANTSLPPKKVHFAPQEDLVQVRPIPTRSMEKEKQKTQEQSLEDLPKADVKIKDTGLKTTNNPGMTLGAMAGIAAAVLAKAPTMADQTMAAQTVLPPVKSFLSEMTKNVTSTLASTVSDVVAPALLATLSNATTEQIVQSTPTLLSNNSTALAAPALSLAQMVAPAAVSAVSNGTCSIVASAVNALAAPALTVAQIVNGNAPIVATELAKQLPMSWTSIALVVGSLAIKGWFPMAAMVYNG